MIVETCRPPLPGGNLTAGPPAPPGLPTNPINGSRRPCGDAGFVVFTTSADFLSSLDVGGFCAVAGAPFTAAAGAAVFLSDAAGFLSEAAGFLSVAAGFFSVATGFFSATGGFLSCETGFLSVAAGFLSCAAGGFAVSAGRLSCGAGVCVADVLVFLSGVCVADVLGFLAGACVADVCDGFPLAVEVDCAADWFAACAPFCAADFTVAGLICAETAPPESNSARANGVPNCFRRSIVRAMVISSPLFFEL
jgi:hypothetical protein